MDTKDSSSPARLLTDGPAFTPRLPLFGTSESVQINLDRVVTIRHHSDSKTTTTIFVLEGGGIVEVYGHYVVDADVHVDVDEK